MGAETLSFTVNLAGLVQAFALMFIVMDPIGNAPFFYAVTKDLSLNERIRIVNFSVVVATVILLIFALVGDIIMGILGITTSDFKIAAGIVLLVYSIMGFLEMKPSIRYDKASLAVVPLATPLLAGPGAIASVIYIKYTWGIMIAVLSTILVSLISVPILYSGQLLDRVLGKSGTLVLDKVMMLLMSAFAIAIIRSGIEELAIKIIE